MQEVVYVLVHYKVSYDRKTMKCPFLEMAAPLKSYLYFFESEIEVHLFVFVMSCTPNKAMKKIIHTILINTAIFYYKNNIYLYSMLHVLSPKDHSSGTSK